MPKLLNTAADYEMVPIGRLKPHPQNVNQADLGAVIESIKAHGFYGALVVQRGSCHVVAGNHRLLAARTLGFNELPVTWITCTDDMAVRLMLTDNRTTRLGQDNPAALANLLTELAGAEQGLTGLGYDGDDLDQLINDLAHRGVIDQVNGADTNWVGMPDFTPGGNTLKIVVSFLNEADRDEFAAIHELEFMQKQSSTWMTIYPFEGRKDLESLRYE